MTVAKRQEIMGAILSEIQNDNHSPVKTTAERFGITRQTVDRYLKKLVEQGMITASGGQTRRRYSMSQTSWLLKTKGLEEDVVWNQYILPILPKALPRNVLDACIYGFTEILNNAIDHSDSESVFILVEQKKNIISFTINDEGIGIFNKIQNALTLSDLRHAILELAKGKLTTDPSRHSGEGIFFTSRIFDKLTILSNGLKFLSGRKGPWDILFDNKIDMNGTWITMEIANNSDVKVSDVFEKFADAESFGFSKTHIPVKLMQHEGQMLVSRSQAKRLITRFEKFTEVILDFDGVEEVGQAFADELFRVFTREHPNVHLIPIHFNDQIHSMIKRAQIKTQR